MASDDSLDVAINEIFKRIGYEINKLGLAGWHGLMARDMYDCHKRKHIPDCYLRRTDHIIFTAGARVLNVSYDQYLKILATA